MGNPIIILLISKNNEIMHPKRDVKKQTKIIISLCTKRREGCDLIFLNNKGQKEDKL